MGAAVRAAYFLGAAGVLTCARNSAPLTPAVSKASAGAVEFMPIHACASMPRTLTQAAQQGWRVIGQLLSPLLLLLPSAPEAGGRTTEGPVPDTSFGAGATHNTHTHVSCLSQCGRKAVQPSICKSALPQESCLCAGAGNEADGVSCRGYKPDKPSILAVGNEGRGLRAVVRRACQDVLRIDSMVAAADQFAPVGVESLNVSVATGILLHQLLQPTKMA